MASSFIVPLAAVLCLIGVSCKSTLPDLKAAHADRLKMGAFTSVSVNPDAVRKEFAHSAFKKSLGTQFLNASVLLAGGIAAGSVGGQAGVQGYNTATALNPPSSLDPNGPARARAAVTEADLEILLEMKMQQLLPAIVQQRLERALNANNLTKSRINPAANCSLSLHLDAIQHDHKHHEHYLVADATAQIQAANGKVLWKEEFSGCSYRKEGKPQTAPATSAAELLATPGMLQKHLDSVAGGIAESLQEELLNLFETLDEM